MLKPKGFGFNGECETPLEAQELDRLAGRHDTLHNDTGYNDTLHNGQNCDTKKNIFSALYRYSNCARVGVCINVNECMCVGVCISENEHV